ncbi:unnamed protein product, partial [Ascophyllum nodosum]
ERPGNPKGTWTTRGRRESPLTRCTDQSDDLGVSRAESQSTEREGTFPLQASVDGFLYVSYTSPEQECILLQADVGANIRKTTSSEQVAAREEFARPSKKRQQQRMTSWTTEQSKQLGNDQKQELPVIFWPEMGVPVNNSYR